MPNSGFVQWLGLGFSFGKTSMIRNFVLYLLWSVFNHKPLKQSRRTLCDMLNQHSAQNETIEKEMKKIIIILSTTFFLFQSCGNGTEKKTTNTKKKVHTTVATIPTKFTSLLRPNEKLELGKIYTDKVKYVNFDDNGDNWLFLVKKDKDTIALISLDIEKSEFIRGDELEIQWKMDSIRNAGDPEFLDFREFLVSAKKIKPLKLTDKKIKFLWREEEDGISYIKLNEEYIKQISEPEKAVLAYVATNIGNECEWDGKANENRSNLKCKILWSLDLGYQCSYTHLDFLRFWFRNNKGILKELENCPTTPDGATVQDTFDEINLEIEGNIITVFFKANGINMREEKTWSWTEKHIFEFKKNELILLKKDISQMERGTFEVRGN